MKNVLNFRFSIVFMLSWVCLQLIGFETLGANTERETRQVPAFTSIINTGSVDVVVKQGATQSVVVEADAGVANRIRTEVSGKVLTISNQGTFRNIRIMKVWITVPLLEEVKMAGSGDLTTDGVLKCQRFTFRINGSGDARLHLEATDVEGKTSGSGDIDLAGVSGLLDLELTGSGDVEGRDLRLSHLKLRVNGSGDVTLDGLSEKLTLGHYSSGDINLSGLKAQEADIEQKGSGDCRIFVTNSLNLTNSGSGDVFVAGNPQHRRAISHGSGNIHYQ